MQYYNSIEGRESSKTVKVLYNMPLVMAVKDKADATMLNDLISKYNETHK